MSASLLVRTACTTGSSAWYTLWVEAAGSATRVWPKIRLVNGFIWAWGTLMYGLIHVFRRSYWVLLKIGSAGTPTGCFWAIRLFASRIAWGFESSFCS